MFETYRINDHRLVGAPFRPSPNCSGIIRPEAIVIHYTAGESGAADWLCQPEARASAHVVIGRQGRVTQLVPFNRRAWHAGRSSWHGRPGLNGWSIGIELENWGACRATDVGVETWTGRKLEPGRLQLARHRNEDARTWWETYPAAQVASCILLCASLVEAYPGIGRILGHDDVAPGRKRDPGPLFPMELVRRVCLPATAARAA